MNNSVRTFGTVAGITQSPKGLDSGAALPPATDADLIPSNILHGVNILGVVGTAERCASGYPEASGSTMNVNTGLSSIRIFMVVDRTNSPPVFALHDPYGGSKAYGMTINSVTGGVASIATISGHYYTWVALGN